jgi:hypothetical protein
LTKKLKNKKKMNDFDVMSCQFINDTFNMIISHDLYCDEVLEIDISEVIEILHLPKKEALQSLNINDDELYEFMKELKLNKWCDKELNEFVKNIDKINLLKFDTYSKSLIFHYYTTRNVANINKLLIYLLDKNIINSPEEFH